MANYSSIKNATNAYIRTNGRQEITGNILNAVLIATIDALGKYFQFAGVADRDTNPGTPDENVIYITGEAGTYANFGGIVVNAGEMALLVWNGHWVKQVIKIVPEYTSQLQNDSGFINNAVGNLLNYYNKSETYTKGQVDDLIAAVHQFEFVVADELPEASADTMYKIYLIPADGADTDNVKDEYVTIEEEGVYSWEMIGTTAVDLSDYPTNEQMAQAIDDSLAAYISSINASVDANVGTPSVDVTYSSGVLTLAFHNLKGQTGEQGVPGPAGVTSANVTVDNNTGIPSVEATLNAGVLTLTFHNLKGAQGDTGSSVDYPFTLVNNTTTDDPLQALTAAMGKYLQDQISQLENKVDELENGFFIPAYTLLPYPIKTDSTIGTSPTYNHTSAISVKKGQKVKVKTAGYSIALISKDNGNGTYTSLMNVDSGDADVPATYIWEAEEDTEISVTVKITKPYSISIETVTNTIVKELEKRVGVLDCIPESFNLSLKDSTSGHFVKIDGTIGDTEFSNVNVYEFGVLPNHLYLVSGRVGTFVGSCLCAFYDADGNYIQDSSMRPSMDIGVTYIDDPVIAPNNAYTIKISGNSQIQDGIAKGLFVNTNAIEINKLFGGTKTYRSIIGSGSHFDDKTIVSTNSFSAGDWTIRYEDVNNRIEKQEDGSFKVVVNRTSGVNPGIWIRGVDLTEYINKPCRCRFYIKNEKSLSFDTGSPHHTLGVHNDFQLIEIEDVIGFSLNRIQIFFSYPGPGECVFYLKDFYCEVIDGNYTDSVSGLLADNNARFAGKRVSILGDSYSGWGTPDQDNARGFWTYPGNRCRYPQNNLDVPVVSQMWWYKLITSLNMNFGINESWAGSRISWDGVTESTDIGADKHLASATRISHLDDNGVPDFVIIQGGSNDIAGNVSLGEINTENPAIYTDEQIAELPVNTFSDAVRTMIIRVMKAYPNARIVFLSPIYNKANSLTITNISAYVGRIKDICDLLGCIFVDLRKMGLTPYDANIFGGDNVHPNAEGMEKIYRYALSAFRNI